MVYLLHTVKDGEDKPKLTDQEITGGVHFRTGPRSKLLPLNRSPSNSERKKMAAMATGWIVKHTMSNILYTFGGKDRKQMMGGLVGDEITQASSRHLGNEFDKLLQEKYASLDINIEVFDQYADDQNVALRDFGEDLKFCPLDGRMKQKSVAEKEQDKDKRTYELIMEDG